MRYYDNVEEVRRRLVGGIVIYRNEPVFVVEAAAIKGSKARYGVCIRNLPGQDRSWKIALDDPELNYRSMRVGFMNINGDVLRAVRYPQRSVAQSVGAHNCTIYTLDGKNLRNYREPTGQLIPAQNFVQLLQQHQEAVDSVSGRFPDMVTARKEVETGRVKARAFHYDWAYALAYGAPVLWYKSQAVGLTLDPRKIFKLENRLSYLKESLEEIGIHVS